MSNIISIFVFINQLKQQTMKITKTSLINLIDDKLFMDTFMDDDLKFKTLHPDKTELFPIIDHKINFTRKTGFRKLVLSSKSLEIVKNFVISEDMRLDILRSIPNRKDIILLDEKRCIKYEKTDKSLDILYVRFNACGKMTEEELKNDDGGGFKYGQLNLETGKFYDRYDQNSSISHIVKEIYPVFIKVITYLELTPTVLLVVNGGEKKGDIMKNNFIKNETKSSVIQVNSNWNYKMIRLGTFKVRGHFRLQACGPNLSQHKLIYVDMFEKGLMKRLSQKELKN